ncbi:MAG: TIGR00725 family protein [Candidatus Thermoplasmatota archaeon]|nr:TIGR00725 family protein [Candidatus Thermoplasmatota archaeon]
MYVSVVGGQQCSPEIYSEAVGIGRRIAGLPAVLVTGGLGGVMEAAAKGASEAGGTAIGIVPTENRDDGNPYLDHVIVTGIGQARNALVVLNGDLVIAVDGRHGTLSEMAMAIKYGKPVYGYKSWDIGIPTFDDVDELFQAVEKQI